MGGTPGAPPLGHCPRDVINLKNAPTFGHSQAPPPLDIVRVTSSTYSKGGTKLLKGGTKLLKGGTKLLKGGTKLLKGGTKSLGWATGGGRTTPPTPPWLRACYAFTDGMELNFSSYNLISVIVFVCRVEPGIRGGGHAEGVV